MFWEIGYCSHSPLNSPNFSFLIGKQKTFINDRKKEKYKKFMMMNNKGNQETKLREDKNSEREEQLVKPQQRDHSKRLRWHKSFNSSTVFSLSSKDWRFCSNHTIHIKHPRTKFQMSELCFPCHWYQQDNKPTTNLGITQRIPKA